MDFCLYLELERRKGIDAGLVNDDLTGHVGVTLAAVDTAGEGKGAGLIGGELDGSGFAGGEDFVDV